MSLIDIESSPVAEGANSTDIVSGVVAGRTRAIARLITQAEAGNTAFRPALAEVYCHTGHAHIVGITGVPGSGKSTLAQALVQEIRPSGRTVAIVAMDPSSPFSGGSILGDRIRMTEIANDPGVFIRSMATRGALGGLGRATLDAVDVLDAAGFDIVLVETVGVGQDEVDVVQATYTTIVVSPPGLGDEIQAIKAGVLEIADIHVVSKCDRSDAAKTVADLKQMLTLSIFFGAHRPWAIPIIRTSVESNEGIGELVQAIDQHRLHLEQTSQIAARRKRIAKARTIKIVENIIRGRFGTHHRDLANTMFQHVSAREIDPHTAAIKLLAALDKEIGYDSNKKCS